MMDDGNNVNKYSVDQIMEITGQKRGTINAYRELLVKYELLSNHQNLDDLALSVFQKAVQIKEEEAQKTWVSAMEVAIQNGYQDKVKFQFQWTNKIIVRSLISDINSERVEIIQLFGSVRDRLTKQEYNREFEIVFDFMIDNFIELGVMDSTYQGSRGTDGNGATTFKICGPDYAYYLVGKVNTHTGREDIHILYNEGLEFNLMRCKYIFGGPTKEGIINQLWLALCNHCRKESNIIPN